MLNSQIKLNKFSTIFYESNNKDFLIKKGSCYHIVPFLMKLSGIENDNLSKGVSKSIIALDTLARKIDFKIDNISINPFSDSNNLSIEKVKGLENKIVDSLHFLENENDFKKLLTDTKSAINKSFEYNTTKRHIVYNLKDFNLEKNSTMGYIEPLISFLLKKNNLPFNLDNCYRSFATYVQVLDDYIDIIEDLKNLNMTPITTRYYELSEKEDAFKILSKEVFQKLNHVFYNLKFELQNIFEVDIIKKELLFWEKYQSEINDIQFMDIKNKKLIEEFLEDFHNKTPPMLCYTG